MVRYEMNGSEDEYSHDSEPISMRILLRWSTASKMPYIYTVVYMVWFLFSDAESLLAATIVKYSESSRTYYVRSCSIIRHEPTQLVT